MKIFLAIIVLMAFWAGPTSAQERSWYATITGHRDGDTVEAYVPAWSNTPFANAAFRGAGFDTPEKAGECAAERELAQRASARTAQLMPIGTRVRFWFISEDRYPGRINVRVQLPGGRDWRQTLISDGLAKSYNGRGARPDWC